MLSTMNANVHSQSRIAHYHRAKAYADNYLRGSDLDYTIICPGGLTEDAGAGMVTVSDQLDGQGKTSRDNLAAALVKCLEMGNTLRQSFSLLEGQTPLDQALGGVC